VKTARTVPARLRDISGLFILIAERQVLMSNGKREFEIIFMYGSIVIEPVLASFSWTRIDKKLQIQVMKAFTPIFFFLALTVCIPMEIVAMDLTQFKWKNRLLFIFAPDANHALFKNLRGEVTAQKEELRDRDVIVFELLEQGPSKMNTSPLDPQQADSIRDHFDISPDAFGMILVGKDGGIKLRRNDQVDIGEIFKFIDSMPMRKIEMQQKNR
jgi:hypothetical protein